MRPENIGPSFETFLKEEGIKDDVYATAVKRVLAWQLEKAMKEANLNKVEMAKKMQTSRAPAGSRARSDQSSGAAGHHGESRGAVGRRLVIELE